MSFIPSFTSPPIGLDVGARTIKAVQLRRARGRHVVTATAVVGRSHPDAPIDRDEALRLRRVLSQQGFAGRSVVLAVPSDRLMSSVIDMPPRDSGAPCDLIAAQEFARLQRQEPGRFELSWWDVPRPARAMSGRVMVIGCTHSDSEPILDVFASCGFDVTAMDAGLCAAVRACRDVIGTTAGVSAVLDMGWSSARLGLVHGGVVVFDRVLTGSGLMALRQRACTALGVEPVEADALIQSVGIAGPDQLSEQGDARIGAVAPMLRPILASHLDDIARELVASFEYTKHQYPDAPPHRLVLVGGGGGIPGAAEYLGRLIAPTIVPASMPAGTPTHRDAATGADAAFLATALGLAGYHGQG